MTPIDETHIIRIFTRMRHLYGHKWDAVYGVATDGQAKLSVAARQWFEDLKGYSVEQLQVGMSAVHARRPEWPPGPLEFMDYCDGIPSLEQVLDKGNDYGPVCDAVRARLDWYNLEAMSTAELRRAAGAKREHVLEQLRRSGEIRAMALAYADLVALESVPRRKEQIATPTN